MAEDTPPYKMTIGLNVLNHLGIGLYSNIPAVLSEVVANAWDADAERVSIRVDDSAKEIVVYDTGNGMNLEDINNRYLHVGYRKRDEEPETTSKGRKPMGRKGIGKLSVFSIADTVEVYSAKDGEKHALYMNAEDIQRRIRDQDSETYHPTPLDLEGVDFDRGTKIVLKDIKKNLNRTEGFLRRRLARRFSIIGSSHEFAVELDGQEITAKDRALHDKVEFLWHMGGLEKLDGGFFVEDGDRRERRSNVRQLFEEDGCVDAELGYEVGGWIGTVDERKSLDDENNSIVVFSRGKLVHEDLLQDLQEGGIYSKYIVGEIEADFMDLDDREDIVTSDRQSVQEDDERSRLLTEFVKRILKKIEGQWTDLRAEVGTERALQNPNVEAWYERLKGDKRKHARKLFGKIESLRIGDQQAKTELYRSSMLAFERLSLKESLSTLDSLETKGDFELLARLFGTIDEIEAVHYYEIARGRLEIVNQFEDMLPEAKERILQQHIFDHLWLLDPSWERAASDQRVEEAVTKEFDSIDAGLTDGEKKGRIDIRYRTAAGKHIIVELKKYDREVTATELVDQVRKYRNALRKCLETKFPDENRSIECICVLGSPPKPTEDEEENTELLRSIGARYLTYDQLIRDAQRSYDEYLKRQQEVSQLLKLIDGLDGDANPLASNHAEDTANGAVVRSR